MDTQFEMDDYFLKIFNAYITKVAKGKRDDAGYSGAHHDGGAGALESAWESYVAGYHKQAFPVSTHHNDFEKKTDPEYIEFLRLKKKFGE